MTYISIRIYYGLNIQNNYKPESADNTEIGFGEKWVNEDPNTRGITRIEFRQDNNMLYVHMLGSCSPNDCDWGEVSIDESDADDGEISINWDHGFADRYQNLTLLNDGR